MKRKQSREDWRKARFEEAIAQLAEQLPPAIAQEEEEPQQQEWPQAGDEGWVIARSSMYKEWKSVEVKGERCRVRKREYFVHPHPLFFNPDRSWERAFIIFNTRSHYALGEYHSAYRTKEEAERVVTSLPPHEEVISWKAIEEEEERKRKRSGPSKYGQSPSYSSPRDDFMGENMWGMD